MKYEIHTIRNAKGEGSSQRFVVLRRGKPLSMNEMASRIEENCTLTKADVVGVLSALREMAAEELREKGRFHLPGMGWLSLTARLQENTKKPGHKVTGNDIMARGIHFQTERDFFDKVRKGIGFVKSKYSSESMAYEKDDLWKKVAAYAKIHGFIDSTAMQKEFALSKYAAYKWLAVFTNEGKLRKSGTNHNFIYLPL